VTVGRNHDEVKPNGKKSGNLRSLRVPSLNLAEPRSEINNAYTPGVAGGWTGGYALPAPKWPFARVAAELGHIR